MVLARNRKAPVMPNLSAETHRLAGVAVFVAAMAFSTQAFAHGDPPAGQQIYEVDGEWVYVTNFGVMTEQWPDRYVCEEAFFGSDDFFVAPLGVEKWVTFTASTVTRTEDGCDFERVGELPRLPTDVAILPGEDQLAYVVRDDETQVWYSDDAGHEFRRVDVELDDIVPSGLGFLEASRLILVGYDASDAGRGTAVLTELQTDGGHREDWPTDDDLAYPELLDAAAGDVLWHAGRDGEDGREVFWSRDGQVDAGHYHSPRWPTAGAVAPDASRAYLGGIGEQGGVFEAHDSEPSDFSEMIGEHRAMCLAGGGEGRLLVCGHRDDDGHDLAVVDPNGDGQLHPEVDFRELRGYRGDCDGDSAVAGNCPAVWEELAVALDIDVEALEEDKEDTDDPGEDTADEDHERACSAAGVQPLVGWALLFFGLFALRSRTPRERPR